MDTKLTDEEWRGFQSIPDQGYSHRAWVDFKIAGRVKQALEDAAARMPDDIHDPRHMADWLRALAGEK